ncbi:TolB family protein [Tabrizicola sp. M-4]|uniref:TolB family protein n=1 Tax=Tabrizicola sp. M-4 TaxID=3055847 RepID=UPI003DA7D2F4
MKSHLSIWDMAEGRARTLLTVEDRIEAPNWYPSGDALLVNGGGRLFRVPLDKPALQPIDTGFADRCNNDHGISPDGSTIILSNHRGRGSEMFMIPASGGTPRLINEEAPSWWHGWSPDGKTLAYVAARGGSRVIDVYTMPVEGGSETRLTFGEGHSDGPDYSHDGKRIYWNCDRDGHAQIWVMDADGANQRKLFADDHVNWFPHPSPDGRHLLYLAYPPGTEGHPADLPVALVLCKPDGTDRRRILEFTGGQGTMNVPNWAPDSHAFAFVRYTA